MNIIISPWLKIALATETILHELRRYSWRH